MRKNIVHLMPWAAAFAFLLLAGCGSPKIIIKESIEELQQKVNDDPNSEIAYYNLGVGYLSKDKYEEAVPCFEKALKIDEHFAQAYFAIYCAKLASDYGLRQALHDDEPPEEYRKQIDSLHYYHQMAVMCNPFFEWKLAYLILAPKPQASSFAHQPIYDLYNMLFYNGYECLIAGEYAGALNYFDYMIDKVPVNDNQEDMLKVIARGDEIPYEVFLAEYKTEARFYRGLTFGIAGDYASAVKDFTPLAGIIDSLNKGKIMPVYVNPSDIYYMLGSCYLNLGNYAEAKNAFERALTEDFSCYMAHYNLSGIYYEEKNYSEALAELDAALLIVPNNSIMHYNKAYFLVQLNKLNEAIEEYNKAIELNLHNYRALYNAGFLCEALGDKSKALKYFDLFLKNAPQGEASLIAEVKTELQTLQAN
ncbi:MAG TPA: tetratricopeptide repeat protein [Ignavibacteriales bacterium]|nr:tetratricopeptide repeat protein [Ignavibacteriales bacterium]